MITESDNLKCQNSFDEIDSSSLEPRTKSELKETIEEAKLNLNGRNLEERCASIARNQFETTRFLANIIIQFKAVADSMKKERDENQKRTWKDVLVEVAWPLVALGSVLGIAGIFQPQIISLFKDIVGIIR